MKRVLFKQLMVSALFACSLSADVPDMREEAGEDGLPTEAQRAKAGRQTPLRETATAGQVPDDGGRSANQTGTCSFGLGDGHAQGMQFRPLAITIGAVPNLMAYVLSATWPPDGFDIQSLDRSNVRWEVAPKVSQETMNIPAEFFDAALLCPRYQMPLVLQESVWPAFADLPTPAEAGFAKAGALRAGRPHPFVFWELAPSLDVVDRSNHVDIAAIIPRLKKVFVKEGVPQQWVWVAEVESALNPEAISSAGAVGLFQLMPGTARRFGLRTTPLDDRMEPEKSASAAAQYLNFLHREFGSWSLALAAYNAGEGRVKEIMKKRNACTFNEVERYLPSETRAYVPKVMAIVAMREDQLRGVPGAYWMP